MEESPPTNDRTRNIGIQWEQVLEYVTQWPFTPYREYVESVIVRFGIPNEYRGAFWQRMSRSTEMKVRNVGLYQKLLATPSLYQKNIEADVHRSFPNATIKDAVDTPEKLAALYNVLHAYSVLDKLVSYCQGMNYMVAVLLMFMEERGCFLGACKYNVSLWNFRIVQRRYPSTRRLHGTISLLCQAALSAVNQSF